MSRVNKNLSRYLNANLLPGWTTVLLATASVAALSSRAMGSTITVFDDTFANGSALQPSSYPAPTSNSAGYDVASTVVATTSAMSSGDFGLNSAKSSSEISEAQAIFTHSPLLLGSAGSQIDLIVSFKDTASVMVAGSSTSASLDFGLYNSGGSPSSYSSVAPYNNLNNAGLSSTLTNDASGGATGYLGYVAETFFTGNNSGARIRTRPGQSSTNNSNQDLIADAANSASYAGGTTLGSTSPSSALTLVAGNTYTEDFSINLTAAGVETTTSTLYSGGIANIGVVADQLNSFTASTSTHSNFETSSFDAFAFGYRNTTNAVPSALDVSEIQILSTTPDASPEPASLSILAAAGASVLAARRRGSAR